MHWEQEDSNLPDVVEAHRRIVENGHFTRLSHPSPAQLERYIPAQSPKAQGLLLRARRKNVVSLSV